MKLNDLKKKGAMIQDGLVTKEVEWKHKDEESGEEVIDKFNVFVVRQNFATMSDVIKNDAPGFSRVSAIIASCVRFGDSGEEVITYEEACALHPMLGGALLKAVNEVNSNGKN
jgi:hypothetical protein